jgi:hypothetical protein
MLAMVRQLISRICSQFQTKKQSSLIGYSCQYLRMLKEQIGVIQVVWSGLQ